MTDTNGVLLNPANFFIANSNLLNQSVGPAPALQSPLSVDVNGAGHKLTNIGTLAATNINATSITGTFIGNGAALTNAAGAMLDVTRPPFNAVGDGVTDDTPAFTNALAASQASGLPVFVPNRTFKLSPFTIYNGQALYGQNGARLLASSNSAGVFITIDYHATNVALCNLEIDGGTGATGWPGSNDGREGLLYWNVQNANWDVSGLYIHGFGTGVETYGLYATDAGLGTFRDSIIQYCYIGLKTDAPGEYMTFSGIRCFYNYIGLLDGAANNLFPGCHFDFNNINLICATGSNYGHHPFSGCTFNHCGSYAILGTNIQFGNAFESCEIIPPQMYFTNCQGFGFNNCLMGWNTTNYSTITFDHCTNCAILFPQNPYNVANSYTFTTLSCSNVFLHGANGGAAGLSIADAELSANVPLLSANNTFTGTMTVNNTLNANGISFGAVNGPAEFSYSGLNVFVGGTSGYEWNNENNTTNLATLDNSGNFSLKTGTLGLAVTNTAPASTNAPKAWVSISVGGTAYKVGLYQ